VAIAATTSSRREGSDVLAGHGCAPHLAVPSTGPRPFEEGLSHTGTIHAFHDTTDARYEHAILGEGKAMIFVTRDQVFDRDLGAPAALVLPLYLGVC